MHRRAIVLLVTLLGCRQSASAEAVSMATLTGALADGDLIFQESRSAQSAAVKAATGSRYSHMGLVFGVAEGHPYVLEAVQPVRKTALHSWLQRGADRHFVLMRTRSKLDVPEARKLRRAAERFLGLPYDGLFDWSDDRIYCSELAWKAYQRGLGVRLGEPEPWRSLRLDDAHVQALAKQRLGHLPDSDAPVVTPLRMMSSPLLTRVLAGELR